MFLGRLSKRTLESFIFLHFGFLVRTPLYHSISFFLALPLLPFSIITHPLSLLSHTSPYIIFYFFTSPSFPSVSTPLTHLPFPLPFS